MKPPSSGLQRTTTQSWHLLSSVEQPTRTCKTAVKKQPSSGLQRTTTQMRDLLSSRKEPIKTCKMKLAKQPWIMQKLKRCTIFAMNFSQLFHIIIWIASACKLKQSPILFYFSPLKLAPFCDLVPILRVGKKNQHHSSLRNRWFPLSVRKNLLGGSQKNWSTSNPQINKVN